MPFPDHESDEGTAPTSLSKSALKKLAKIEFRKENGRKKRDRSTAEQGSSAAPGDGHHRHSELVSSSGGIPTYNEMLALTPTLSTSGKEIKGPSSGPSKEDVDAFITGLNGNKVGSLEIYARFPLAYDILMSFHNCDSVSQLMWSIINADRKFSHDSHNRLVLLDVGCGTGRLSRLLVDRHKQSGACGGVSVVGYDKYPHMLRIFHERLHGMGQWEVHPTPATMKTDNTVNQVCLRPISFEQLGEEEGVALGENHPRADAIMMGWSLSYIMRSAWSDEACWKAKVSRVLNNLIRHCGKTTSLESRATPTFIFVLETLGVGVSPSRNSPLITYLIEEWGFRSFEYYSNKSGDSESAPSAAFIRTDYNFPNKQVASSLCQFFFAGARVPALLEDSPSGTLLPECTGLWVKQL